LGRLKDLLDGQVTELCESAENARTVRLLLPRDGRDVKVRGKGATWVSLVSHPTHAGTGGHSTFPAPAEGMIPRGKAGPQEPQGLPSTPPEKLNVPVLKCIQIEGLTLPSHDGLSVSFPPTDVSEYRKAGGVLRFYINGGGAGNQQFTFWLYARAQGGGGKPEIRNPKSKLGDGRSEGRDSKGWMWVSLRDYVTIDDLEATWQLVSIPLDRLVREDYPEVTGFGMNNAVDNDVCGPVWIADLYVAMNREPVERQVAVSPPPPQRPATRAMMLPIGVQPTTSIGGAGVEESHLLLGLKLDANGSLTRVRIALRLVTLNGEVVLSEPVFSAARLRTPWWSTSLRFTVPRALTQARLEMVLASTEVNATYVTEVRW
jgi:hypothetical protein